MSKAARSVATRSFKRFVRKEDGNIATFSVLLFSLMVMCGGLAVDLMRYEHLRTSLQQTLDRCTLAAAALKQTLDRTEVCRDYAAKAGLSIPASSVKVTTGVNSAQVQVSASLELPTIFAGMVGINKFDVPARSSAMQAVTNVEIALVLDVSGSMTAPATKLSSMKTAAKSFVTTVLANDTQNRTSIALVPYNGQVNLGAVLAARYNVTEQHNLGATNPAAVNTFCVDMPPAVYATNTLSATLAMPQSAFADLHSGANTDNMWQATNHANAIPNAANRWCPNEATNIVRLPSNDQTTLHTRIDGLVGIGATSINAGMKWGMAMLDPANRSMFTALRTAGEIPAAFVNRPFDYTVSGDPIPASMKVIVLMTDGEHFPEKRINAAFRSGGSRIFRSNDGILSIRHDTGRPASAGTNTFFSPSACSAPAATPTANVPTSTCNPWSATARGQAPYTELTWPKVFEANRMSYIAFQLYARALGTDHNNRISVYNDTLAAMRTITPSSEMDDQLQEVCSMARTRNVTVYGIAFEAPANGQTMIRSCATSLTHYYEASTLNVATTFQSIATRISQLRLTQ